jgi:hypothetical protein
MCRDRSSFGMATSLTGRFTEDILFVRIAVYFYCVARHRSAYWERAIRGGQARVCD